MSSPWTDCTAQREIGRYVLEVGNAAGTTLVEKSDRKQQGNPAGLAKALRTSKKPLSCEPLEGAINVADKLKHALELFNGLAEGRLSPAAVSDEVDDLLGLLRRLDRDERWKEALDVARVLSMLLALLLRWVDLLRSLRLALNIAERLGDDDMRAWALHELGTMHLLAGRRPEAERLLGAAHDTRKQTGDRRAQTVTDHNLQVLCHALRMRLRQSKTWSGPKGRALIAALALSLLVVGGAAGAAMKKSGKPKPAVAIEVTPASPLTGEQVAFHVISNSSADPYVWWFGDGRSSALADPKHRYRKPGRYTAIVTVTDAGGAILGSASRLITVVKEHHPPTPTTKRTTKRTTKTETTNKEPGHGSITTKRSTKASTGKTTSTKLSAKTARVPSNITAECPSRPVLLGSPTRMTGTVTPSPTTATVTVLYSMPDESSRRQTSTTDEEGGYTNITKADSVGEWKVTASWPGDETHDPDTSRTCSFEVLSSREAYLRSSK